MFITFEGIDGSGKSTQARSIAGWLYKEAAHGTLLTHEPGGWDGGQVLRNMVLTEGLRHRWSEPYLFMLDRAEHVARVIQPALDSGKIVLCERYHDSTLAYQSWGRGIPADVLNSFFMASSFGAACLVSITKDFPLPVWTVFLLIKLMVIS